MGKFNLNDLLNAASLQSAEAGLTDRNELGERDEL